MHGEQQILRQLLPVTAAVLVLACSPPPSKERWRGHSYGGYYGLHWWIDPDNDAFVAVGLFSQFVWVKPDADLVVVRFGEYERKGTEAIRTGRNYHDTKDEGAFDGEVFGQLVVDALVE